MDEIARLFGVHKNTVRNWLQQGLAANDDRRPTLVLGWQLRRFLEERRQVARQRCAPGYLYCVRCREPRAPALGMVDYIPYTASTGNLRGICPECDAFIHRRVALAKIEACRGDLDVRFPQPDPRLVESSAPTVNCDFDKDVSR